MATTSVTIQLPDELPSALHRSPGELAQDIRLAAAIDWYRQRLLSQGRAAEIAGLSQAAFLDALATVFTPRALRNIGRGRGPSLNRPIPVALPVGFSRPGRWPPVSSSPICG